MPSADPLAILDDLSLHYLQRGWTGNLLFSHGLNAD
jgi:hypothetical protein